MDTDKLAALRCPIRVDCIEKGKPKYPEKNPLSTTRLPLAPRCCLTFGYIQSGFIEYIENLEFDRGMKVKKNFRTNIHSS